MRGCFRGCSRRVFEVRITLSKSLTRSRQFRNEIHGDPYTEAFTRRFNLERTIPSRAAAKSGERLLCDIRIGAHIRHPSRRASRFLREWSDGCYTDLSRIVIRRVYGDLRLSTVVDSTRDLPRYLIRRLDFQLSSKNRRGSAIYKIVSRNSGKLVCGYCKYR